MELLNLFNEQFLSIIHLSKSKVWHSPSQNWLYIIAVRKLDFSFTRWITETVGLHLLQGRTTFSYHFLSQILTFYWIKTFVSDREKKYHTQPCVGVGLGPGLLNGNSWTDINSVEDGPELYDLVNSLILQLSVW